MAEERLTRAEALLQEAVYRSRARQAAGAGLLRARDEASGPTNCGLGREAAVDLDLSDEARGHFRALWPEDPSGAELERIRDVMRAWVVRQDALDRDRNHFMKAFRNEHGFDRSAYSPEQLAAWERGLEEVNARATSERRLAAERLLG
jgi:hypothetical protein